jgi:hypothetical protein
LCLIVTFPAGSHEDNSHLACSVGIALGQRRRALSIRVFGEVVVFGWQVFVTGHYLFGYKKIDF